MKSRRSKAEDDAWLAGFAMALSEMHPRAAEQLARMLVERYPEHGFVIDFEETQAIGMHAVKEPTPEQTVQLDRVLLHITEMNAFGRVVGV